MSTEKKFNRANWKDTTSGSELAAADKAVENIFYKNKKSEFLSIDEGRNVFLMMPSHESIKRNLLGEDIPNELFMIARQDWWLPVELEDRDEKGNPKKDGQGRPIMTVKNRSVLDARLHSEAKIDIVDEYVKLLRQKFERDAESDSTIVDKQKFIKESMYIIYGSPFKATKKVQGISGKLQYIGYAQKVTGSQKTLGRVQVGKAVKNRINEICSLQKSGQVLSSEANNPLIDIEDRRALIIDYNSKADDPSKYYITEIDQSSTKIQNMNVLVTYPISDEELNQLLNLPSLTSMYKNCYTLKMFEFALKGLQLFDEKHEFGIFNSQEFLQIAEEMRTLYPEGTAEVQAETDEMQSDTDANGLDKFDKMDRDEMKRFIRDNRTGTIVHSHTTDDQIRTQLREWETAHDTAVATQNQQGPPLTDATQTIAKPSAKERIDQIRKGTKV